MLFHVALRRRSLHGFPAGAAIPGKVSPNLLLFPNGDQDVDVDARHDHHWDEEQRGESDPKLYPKVEEMYFFVIMVS